MRVERVQVSRLSWDLSHQQGKARIIADSSSTVIPAALLVGIGTEGSVHLVLLPSLEGLQAGGRHLYIDGDGQVIGEEMVEYPHIVGLQGV